MIALIAKVSVVIFIVNAVLSGAKVALDKIQAVVKSRAVDQADSWVTKALSYVAKVIDFISANVPH